MVRKADQMNDIANPVLLDTRLAGQVKRFHTWPITSHQTVAEHCWQCLRIYLSIVDKVDPHVVRHIAFHDLGEISVGDLPYPTKRDNPSLKAQMDILEQRACISHLQHWKAYQPIMLTDEDKVLVKQIEMIEMAEYGMYEMCLGNSYAFIVADRCLDAVYQGEPCLKLAQYIKIRLDLFFTQLRIPIRQPLSDHWRSNAWEKVHGGK
jgi:5'-deoxynucleotidase YfbR-like HD superfamily hydrolase